MLQLRERDTRGVTDIDWLKSYHTFSFGEYYDPKFMGFSDLRVINDDWVEPGKGFPTHGHRDMEIITYVLEGQVAHRDSMGNVSTIEAGELQRMTAGSGVTHSEYNPSLTDRLHLLQIWIFPEQKGLTPGYEQKSFADNSPLQLVASHDGREGSLTIHQDTELYLARLEASQSLSYTIPPHRTAWLHVAQGEIRVNEVPLKAGDSLGVTESRTLDLTGLGPKSEVLLFNLRPLSGNE